MSKKETDPSNLPLRLSQNTLTAPSSPKITCGPGKQSTKRALNKIKSLGRLDIRAPLLSSNVLLSPAVDPSHDNDALYPIRTSATSLYRLMNVVPETFYTMRNYYNDFTTIDWASAFITTNKFQFELKHKHWIVNKNVHDGSETKEVKIPLYYRAYLISGRWVSIVVIALLFSVIAFAIDKTEIVLIGFKHGYCRTNWFASQVSCCYDLCQGKSSRLQLNVFRSGYVLNTKTSAARENLGVCENWISWSSLVQFNPLFNGYRLDLAIYVILTVILALSACLLTLSTKISRYHQAANYDDTSDLKASDSINTGIVTDSHSVMSGSYVQPRSLYTAAGSGVPEVKTILSGFVIRRFLGAYTLVVKTIALVLAIASGMSLGKEGPYVHLATSVGNIVTRCFPFIYENELLRKQVLSAAAASGVALAFGSPLGGVLFILEEINHTLPSNQLFLIFFCAISSTLFLKFLDPYGTGKTVLFELKYTSDWQPLELICFIIIGISGGVFGATFVKFVRWWPSKFRSHRLIRDKPVFEVAIIALLTGLITFWNPYTKQATSELVLDLATSCSGTEQDRSLCPTDNAQLAKELSSLCFALVVKIILTFVTFGLKLPIGIYVPSMVIGALFGRIFSMFIQWLNILYNTDSQEGAVVSSMIKAICSSETPSRYCVDLGIYSMISAGAFMAGVTRMNITLVIILFELTSSYTYVLPISIAIAVANFVGHLIEPMSLYESLLVANDYPFLPPETEALDPLVTAGQIVTKIDIYQEAKDRPTNNTASLPSTPAFGRNSAFLKHHNLAQLIDSNDDRKLYVDISTTPYVPAYILKRKLSLLAEKSLLDGCVPLIKSDVCVGMIFFPDLEFCIDKIEEFCTENNIEDEIYCKVHKEESYQVENNPNAEVLRRASQNNRKVVMNQISNEPNDADYFSYGTIPTGEDKDLSAELIKEVTRLSDLTDHVNYSPIFVNYDSELSLIHLIFERIGNRVIVLLKDGKYYGVLHKKTLIDYTRRKDSTESL